jgi:hypothetical protein
MNMPICSINDIDGVEKCVNSGIDEIGCACANMRLQYSKVEQTYAIHDHCLHFYSSANTH